MHKRQKIKKANFVCLIRKFKKNFASGIAKRSYAHLFFEKKRTDNKKAIIFNDDLKKLIWKELFLTLNL